MPLHKYSDPMVFALATASAPHLRHIRHPGHFSLLVAWTRAKEVAKAWPTWTAVKDRVYAPYRDFLAVADFSQLAPRWHQVGWNAGSLLARRFVIDTGAPSITLYQRSAATVPSYDEVPGKDDVLGLLALPVAYPPLDSVASLLGVFVLSPDESSAESGKAMESNGGKCRRYH